MKIFDIMLKDPGTSLPGLGFESLLEAHLKRQSRQLYVVDENRKLLGIIGNFELLSLFAPNYLDANLARAVTDDTVLLKDSFGCHKNKTATEIMNRKFQYVEPDDTILSADVLIREKEQVAIPVLDKAGILVGEVTREDILRAIASIVHHMDPEAQ